MDSPLDNRSLVFDPIAGAFFVSVDGAQGEAAYVLLNHLPLVFIGGVGLCGLFGNTAGETTVLSDCFSLVWVFLNTL